MLVSGPRPPRTAKQREGRSGGQPGAETIVSSDSTEKLNRAKFREAHRSPVGTIFIGGGLFLRILRGLPSETMRQLGGHLRPKSSWVRS